MIDESQKLGPISAVVGVGVLSFVIVLGALAWVNGPQSISYFGPIFEPFTTSQTKDLSTPDQRDAVLAALATGSTNSATEEEKLSTLKSLAERVENGEEQLLSVEEKFEVLASLKTQR